MGGGSRPNPGSETRSRGGPARAPWGHHACCHQPHFPEQETEARGPVADLAQRHGAAPAGAWRPRAISGLPGVCLLDERESGCVPDVTEHTFRGSRSLGNDPEVLPVPGDSPLPPPLKGASLPFSCTALFCTGMSMPVLRAELCLIHSHILVPGKLGTVC